MDEVLAGRWPEINALLDKLYDLPTRDQISACKTLCQGDEILFAAIKNLLQLEEKAPQFLEAPAFCFTQNQDHKQSATDPCLTSLEGRRMGAYRLCEKIGQGGMGSVYRARRDNADFTQEVAIKVLNTARTQKKYTSARERFEREQQLLASLNHPNIAQLFDGGVDDEGFAYIVMEYVSGIPIDEYCTQQALQLDDILRLIDAIAQTLQFAHAQLIIHRDIKASNILVSEGGDIKLLDFGIAKLMDTSGQLALTCTGEQVLTPGAAAPEQLLNRQISVATDIYQLGLLAYELISGMKVYEGRAQSLVELIELVCKSEPLPPSSALLQALQQNNDARSTKQKLLYERRHKIKGDIDAIVIKMLRCDPAQRYPSMEALRQDIEAYFHQHPIKARKLSVAYLSKKFLRRHWRLLGLAFFTCALSTGYLLNLQHEAKKTAAALSDSRVSQQQAEELSAFLLNIFKAADPNNIATKNISARELLDQASERVERELSHSPLTHAQMLVSLAEINQSLGEYEKSLTLLQQALAKNLQLLSPQDSRLGKNFWLQGIGEEHLGNYPKALENYNRAYAIFQTLGDKNDSKNSRLHLLNEIGELQFKMGDLKAAQKKFIAVTDAFRQQGLTQDRTFAIGLNNLATIYHRQADFVAAKNTMLEAIALNENILGEGHPKVALGLRNLAVKLIDWEDLDEAQSLMARAVNLQTQYLPQNHADLLNTKRHLAYLYHKQNRLVEAESLLTEVLSSQQQTPGDQVDRAMSLYRLAELQSDAGNFAAAEQNFNEMMAIYRQSQVSDNIIGRGLAGQARLAYKAGDFKHAERIYREALDVLPTASMRTSMTQLGFALLQLKLAMPHEAKALAQQALSFRQGKVPAEHNLLLEVKLVITAADLALASDTQLQQKLRQMLLNQYLQFKTKRPAYDDFLQLAAAKL